MIGDPSAWITGGAILVILTAAAFLGDALGREIRAMFADEPTGDVPASLQGDLPALPDDYETFHDERGNKA